MSRTEGFLMQREDPWDLRPQGSVLGQGTRRTGYGGYQSHWLRMELGVLDKECLCAIQGEWYKGSFPIPQAGVSLRILELNPKDGRDPHS